jgi:hypothetical protein
VFVSDLGRWLEAAGLIGFIAANAAAVFVALWWGLGRTTEPPPEPEDRGAMTAAGVPYVPGPPGA